MYYSANVSNKGQITIPKTLRDALCINEGTKTYITKVDDTLVVIPLNKSKKPLMSLYGSVNPKKKTSNIDVAITKAKKLKYRPEN